MDGFAAMKAYLKTVSPLLLLGVFGYASWLFVHGKIEIWQMFLFSFLAFFLVGKIVFRWDFSGIVFRFFSVVGFFPGAIAFIVNPPYPTLRPEWWVGKPFVHWVALVAAFVLGLTLFWGNADALLNRQEKEEKKADQRSSVVPVLILLFITLLLTHITYPTIERMGQYGDIVLHEQGINALLSQSPVVTEGAKVGYAIAASLKTLTGLPVDAILWFLQWSIRLLFGLTAFALFRKWFPRELAFLGSLTILFYPPVLLTFPQAFLANVGMFLAALFFLVFFQESRTWRVAIAAGLLFVLTLFTNPWLTGYMPLVGLAWCIIRFSQNTASKKELTLFAILLCIGSGVVLSWFLPGLKLFDPQVSIFRSFLDESGIRSFFFFLPLVIVLLVMACFSRARSVSLPVVVNLSLLSLFVVGVGNQPLLFVFALTAWAISLWVNRQERFIDLKRHEQFFLVVVFLNIFMLVVQLWKFPIGHHGAFYILPLPIAYFLLKGLGEIDRVRPLFFSLLLPVFLSLLVIGSLFIQFSYISRFLYATPADASFGFSVGAQLFILALLSVFFLWHARRATHSS